jgi:hypothetical protein
MEVELERGLARNLHLREKHQASRFFKFQDTPEIKGIARIEFFRVTATSPQARTPDEAIEKSPQDPEKSGEVISGLTPDFFDGFPHLLHRCLNNGPVSGLKNRSSRIRGIPARAIPALSAHPRPTSGLRVAA